MRIFGCVLKRHVLGCSLGTDENFVVFHLVGSVNAFREHIAVCLTIHGFRSQGGCHQKNVAILQPRQFFLNFHFNADVFLRVDALTLSSVVVCTHLVVLRTPNTWSLAEDHLILFV